MRVFTHWITTVAREVGRGVDSGHAMQLGLPAGHEERSTAAKSAFLNAGPAQPGRPIVVRSDGRWVH